MCGRCGSNGRTVRPSLPESINSHFIIRSQKFPVTTTASPPRLALCCTNIHARLAGCAGVVGLISIHKKLGRRQKTRECYVISTISLRRRSSNRHRVTLRFSLPACGGRRRVRGPRNDAHMTRSVKLTAGKNSDWCSPNSDGKYQIDIGRGQRRKREISDWQYKGGPLVANKVLDAQISSYHLTRRATAAPARPRAT